MRGGLEVNAARQQGLERRLDFVHLVINHGAETLTRLFREPQHQPYPAAIEKRHVRDLKKKLHAKRVPIKGRRPVEVADGYGDLADPREAKRGIWVSHVASCGTHRTG